MLLPFPKFLHAGQTFEYKPDVAFQGIMDAVERIHDLFYHSRLLDTGDPGRKPFALLAVKIEKNVGTGAFAVCKTIQNCQGAVFGQVSELVQQIAWRAVKADIDKRFLLIERCPHEIQAKRIGQTASRIIPDDIVADIQSVEQAVQTADS